VAQTVAPVHLNSSTVEAFEAYIHAAETGIEESLQGSGPFLWSDSSSERTQQVRQGKIRAERWSGKEPVKIQEGLIHDWIGAVFISATTLKDTLTLVQDYNNHKNIYKPDVIDSKLVGQQDNDFQIYLRVLKKKIITVVLDTDHDVHYSPVDSVRWFCRSLTTRISEVEDAGKSSEKVLPANSGHGFLWRLASYWRFQERDGGVYVECRALSLSRDIPKGLGWIVEPIVGQLPKQSLIHTLAATRKALLARAPRASLAPPCPSSS